MSNKEENYSSKTHNYNVLIVVPAFNSNHLIEKLLIELRENSDFPILIIDDGSLIPIKVDSSIQSINLIRHDQNKGKGAALISGINWAMNHEFSHIISMDSDFQHPPNLIQEFSNIDPEIDLVCGARHFSGSMPYHRRCSNYITSQLISIRAGKKVLDSQCGFRRYKIDSVLKYNYTENGFQFESEILIKLLSNGAKIDHVTIPAIYNNEESSINNFSDTFKFIQLYLSSFFWKNA